MPNTAVKCLSFDISSRLQKDGKNRKTVNVANVNKDYKQTKADTIRDRESIDKIVRFLMQNKRKRVAAILFILGINTGFRCGDLLTFRVRDVLDEDGEVIETLMLAEQKTGKTRLVYFNEAVRTVLAWHIKNWDLQMDSYLFENRSPHALYLDEFVYDELGNLTGMSTVSEKYYMIGSQKYQRQPAPVARRSASDWIKNAAKDCGIPGHFSSHCMRKTFAHFIGIDWADEYNSLAVQKALGHSYEKTTTEHYLSVDNEALRERWMDLNLGLEAFIESIEK